MVVPGEPIQIYGDWAYTVLGDFLEVCLAILGLFIEVFVYDLCFTLIILIH